MEVFMIWNHKKFIWELSVKINKRKNKKINLFLIKHQLLAKMFKERRDTQIIIHQPLLIIQDINLESHPL